jgi:SAM-dependent methyltransferase
MTEQGQLAAAIWRERDFAQSWAHGDGLRDMLDLPRQIAATIVAQDNTSPARILDIASGPGDFLAVFLEQFPDARGIWTDASEAMLELATDRLAPFGDRVEFRIADMTDLAGADVAAGVDVITTSRAAHHLDLAGLLAFYAQAARYLAPGGWLIDLDHTGTAEPWDARLRAARHRLRPAPPGASQHHHEYPLTSVQDHLDAYGAAGINDVEVVWRAFVTCLFMGRCDG